MTLGVEKDSSRILNESHTFEFKIKLQLFSLIAYLIFKERIKISKRVKLTKILKFIIIITILKIQTQDSLTTCTFCLKSSNFKSRNPVMGASNNCAMGLHSLLEDWKVILFIAYFFIFARKTEISESYSLFQTVSSVPLHFWLVSAFTIWLRSSSFFLVSC